MQFSRIKLQFRIRRLTCLASATFLIFAAPKILRAHGELLIRIATATRQIESATNNFAQLYVERGELYREDRNWTAAESDYARAEQLDPKLASVDFCRAKLLADSNQLELANAMFDKVLARDPKNGEAFIGRARILIKLEKRKPAISDFRRGLDILAEPQPEYFVELFQSLLAEGKQDEALRTLDDGIKKFGPIVKLQHYALDLELGRKNIDAALVRLDTIINGAERKENWLAQRGDFLLSAGRPTQAQKAYEDSLAAVKKLPLRLQQGPAMMNLQSRVNASLEKIHKNELAAKQN